jgi:hypothetical protein
MTLAPSSDAVSAAGRAAQDIGIAVLLGGNLFGRRAMHPAVEWVSSAEERGKVVNVAWRRYGTFNSVALVSVVGGWVSARATETGDRFLSPRERALARGKDAAVVAVAVTGVASAIEGVRFGRSAPGGAVPLRSGSEPASATPPPAARTKRVLNALGSASAVAEVALIAVNAALAQENFRRPPTRRLLKRRW